MHAAMHISLERIPCQRDQADSVAEALSDRLRRGGLLVAFHRVVWHEGVAVVAIHHRGRRRRPILTPTTALRIQQARTPLLILEVA